MPNHVHILIKTYKDFELGNIVKSWKSYSSRMIHEFMNRQKKAGLTTSAPSSENPRLWQRGYWDRYIRDEKHFQQTIAYIKKNYSHGGVLIK
jgi:REP-associated tyrosine transposase